MLPTYDFVWGEQPVQRTFLRLHINMSVYSRTLNTRVSFFWIPKITKDLLTLLRKWETGEEDAPSVIVLGCSLRKNLIKKINYNQQLLLGISGHHMERFLPRSSVDYEILLTNLVPLLKTLTSKTLIIWMHQNPIIETNLPVPPLQNPTNRKYDGYNVLARRLLKYIWIIIEWWWEGWNIFVKQGQWGLLLAFNVPRGRRICSQLCDEQTESSQ